MTFRCPLLTLLFLMVFLADLTPSQAQYPGPDYEAATVCCTNKGIFNYPRSIYDLPLCAMQGACVLPPNAGQPCQIVIRGDFDVSPLDMMTGQNFARGISCENASNCTRCVRGRRVCRTPVGDFSDPQYFGMDEGTPCSVRTYRGTFSGELRVPH